MRPAIFYYCLAQTRAANRDRQAQHNAPARAPNRTRHSPPSPRAHHARALLAVVTRRLRTVHDTPVEEGAIVVRAIQADGYLGAAKLSPPDGAGQVCAAAAKKWGNLR